MDCSRALKSGYSWAGALVLVISSGVPDGHSVYNRHMKRTAYVWECEHKDCGHVWLCTSDAAPSHCARCHRRGWHHAPVVVTAPGAGPSMHGQPEPVPESSPVPDTLDRARAARALASAVPGVVVAADLPRTSRAHCPVCHGPLVDWSPTMRRCPGCRVNYSR